VAVRVIRGTDSASVDPLPILTHLLMLVVVFEITYNAEVPKANSTSQ